MKKTIKTAINGCGRLPHLGHHPGTLPLLICLTAGAVLGSNHGVNGMFKGTMLVSAFIVPLYIFTAYDRASSNDIIQATLKRDVT